MKTIILSTFALAAVAAGNDISDDGRKLQQTKDMLSHMLPSTGPFAKGKIFRHGCYCFNRPGAMVGSRNGYHGAPLDELDALCRDLFRSQKCLTADVNGPRDDDGNLTECDANRAYPYTLNAGGSVSCGPNPAIFAKWATKENNACKLKVCELEREFAEAVKALFNSGYVADESISSISGADYDAMCPPVENGIPPPELECCGVGINRKPFNNAVNECCNDNVSALGSC